MSVIRCPHCGKPNPDFLDTCQYCDQVLKEPGASDSGGEGTIRKSLIVRCPKCGKSNPDFAEKCQFCDTPLKAAPAAASATPNPEAEAGSDMPDWLRALRGEAVASQGTFVPSESEATHDWEWTGTAETPAASEPEPAAEIPDWLKSLQGEESAAPATEVPDWLRDLEGGAAPTPPSFDQAATLPILTPAPGEAVPDWMKGAPAESAPAEPPAAASEAEGIPDWLKAMQADAAPAESAPAEPPAAAGETEGIPDWLKAMQPAEAAPAESAPAEAEGAPAEGALPDWLRSATGPLSTPAAPAAAAPADEVPDWLKPAGGAEAASGGELPDWLKSATGPLSTPAEIVPEADLPDWLKTATGPLKSAPTAPTASTSPPATGPFGPATEAAAPAEGLPDWLSDLAPAAGAAAAASPALSASAPLPAVLPGPEDSPDFLNNLRGAATPIVEEEQPDWLTSLGLAEAAETPAPAAPAAPATAEAEPDWMRSLRSESGAAAPAPAPAEADPDWLTALRAEPGAAAAPRSEPAISPFSAEPAPAPAASEPDWLAALRPSGPPSEPGLPPSGELAQGELPTWLAAMRPVDVQRPAVEPEIDEYQETVGVLAGMRGVLRAEPSVVLPGKSATQVHALAFTDAQTKQAELLAGILVGDRAAAPAAQRRAGARALPWERWLVVLFVLIGLLLPPWLLPGLFPLPTTLPADTLAAFQAIEVAPAGRPVLVAFDFEPGQAGELGLAADALVGHVLRRGLPVVAVSTSLTGAGVAQETLTRLTAQTAYADGETYLNLGYLPGGPLGIAQFVRLPQTTVRADFAGRDFPDRGGLWGLPLLASVRTWGDFGIVIVISAAPDDARAWIEQTQGQPGSLVLAVSAGAAPLVRPYVEADQAAARTAGSAPHLAGLVSGAVGATQYQTQAGVYRGSAPAPLQERWEMLGGGLLMIALLLVAGNLIHGLRRTVSGAGRGKA